MLRWLGTRSDPSAHRNPTHTRLQKRPRLHHAKSDDQTIITTPVMYQNIKHNTLRGRYRAGKIASVRMQAQLTTDTLSFSPDSVGKNMHETSKISYFHSAAGVQRGMSYLPPGEDRKLPRGVNIDYYICRDHL